MTSGKEGNLNYVSRRTGEMENNCRGEKQDA